MTSVELDSSALKSSVAFTGRLACMTRAEAFAVVRQHGGKPSQAVTKQTKLLIVGELGWPLLDDGRPSNKLSRATAYGVPVVSERRFLQWIEKVTPDSAHKTYSAEQLAALSKLSNDTIRELAQFGLLDGRGGHFGFRDLASARQIAKLLADGVRLSEIIRSVNAIKKWLPDRELDERFHETDHGTGSLLADSSFVVDRTRSGIMAGWRQAVALAMTGEEIEGLTALSRSRTEPAGRVSRAAMLLGYREKPSFFAVGRRLGVHHQTVQRCVERAMAYGALAALDDRPRPGKEPTITPEAKAWLVSLACDKAKEHGYPHELWTTRLLARHARERGPAAGHQCLARLAQGTVCKLLGQEEIKPHKVRYYLERRDAEFEPKMAEVLCVYREVQVLKKAAAKAEKSKKPVAIVSYDEKPGIQAIATTAPDLPPVPGRHASFARDHEYKRHGTLSLLAGIDLLTGKVHALVRERHRSREFIEFLKLLDAAYPASTAIKLILDNHSAHISRETRAWLDTRPPGRFDFTFTPKHGSWLNLIEGFFSKFARSVLRHIRVTSKHELKQRIMAGIDDVNRHPVIHTWSYKLAEAA